MPRTHLRYLRTPRFAATLGAAILAVTCGGSAPTAPSLPGPGSSAGLTSQAPPTVSEWSVAADSSATCTASTHITALRINANMAGPSLEIEPVFDGAAAPFDVEVERQKNGVWFPWATASASSGTLVKIEAWFNQTYRVRVRVTGCAWSDWTEKVIGRSNPCGSCGTTTEGSISLSGNIN